ncbi:MAG: FAD binding domain-containing protein, partial [Elusimicrobiota bacterium]
KFPLLARACSVVGATQIQNRGTLGGNLAHASAAGDTFPPLLVYEAVIHLVCETGKRRIPINQFFTGAKTTVLRPSELIECVEILFLKYPPARQIFRKVGTRAAQAISKVVAAGLLWLGPHGEIKELRFSLGSMAPTARRLNALEAFCRGKKLNASIMARAAELIGTDVSPIDDLRSSAHYRLKISKNILMKFLKEKNSWQF